MSDSPVAGPWIAVVDSIQKGDRGKITLNEFHLNVPKTALEMDFILNHLDNEVVHYLVHYYLAHVPALSLHYATNPTEILVHRLLPLVLNRLMATEGKKGK